MPKLVLTFGEDSGDECVTSAWLIEEEKEDGNRDVLVTIDLGDYGQKAFDWKFRSEKAEKVARICFKALSEEEF